MRLTCGERLFGDDMRGAREIISFTSVTNGLVYVVDYPFRDGTETAGYKTFFWDAELKRSIRLIWADDVFGKALLTNPSGTGLSCYSTEYIVATSNSVPLIRTYDLKGQILKTARAKTSMSEETGFTVVDGSNSVYLVQQNQAQTRRFLGAILSDGIVYPNCDKDGDLLVSPFQGLSEPTRPGPVLLSDAMTVATYVHSRSNNQYCIRFFRKGTLDKSVADPVPANPSESRLCITGDGQGVVTQIVDGKDKGLVRVWDIATRRVSSIAVLPPVRYMFPWVQGSYAPVWCVQDGTAFDAGILEINRVPASAPK